MPLQPVRSECCGRSRTEVRKSVCRVSGGTDCWVKDSRGILLTGRMYCWACHSRTFTGQIMARLKFFFPLQFSWTVLLVPKLVSRPLLGELELPLSPTCASNQDLKSFSPCPSSPSLATLERHPTRLRGRGRESRVHGVTWY